MQVTIFVNRNDDPSGRMRRFLGDGSYWGRTDRNGADQEQPQPVLQGKEGQEKRQPRCCHISSTREKRERNRSVWELAAGKNCLSSLLPNYFRCSVRAKSKPESLPEAGPLNIVVPLI